MTPALRKRHQRTWWFLGLALLLIWGTSMVAINKNQAVQNQDTTLASTDLAIKLKNGTVPQTQTVSIQVPHPLANPQTLVYLTDNEGYSVEKCQLLGRIDGVGAFEFPLDSTLTAMSKKVIIGYDAIHQKKLFTVVLND